MEILEATTSNLELAGRALARGELVAIPTETVYGLGANAFDEVAVARVFEAKARPSFDPLIVHIADLSQVDRVVRVLPRHAALLMEKLWPGPLTLILPKREELPDLVTSGLPSVALRFPANAIAQAVIRAAGLPIAAPSANPFGYLSPTTARHVADMLGDRVDYIVDGGPCRIGVESTVLDLTGELPVVLRPGGMPVETIARLIGEVLVHDSAVPTPTSPGQLPSHYAPHTPLRLVPAGGLRTARPGPKAVALFFDEASRAAASSGAGGGAAASSGAGGGAACGFAAWRVLSRGGDLVEAAARLFSTLHELDREGFDEIWAERLPEEGLGRAVNDRLYKASEK
jgi:L-threonylcarbamoyladenylate synthase